MKWDILFEKIEKAVKKYYDELAIKDYKDPFKVLIAGIISIRTKEEITKQVLKNLFSNVKEPKDILNLSLKELENLLKPSGFYKQKAKWIKELSKKIIEKYNGKVPDTYEDLIKLPGVGNKVAKLVLDISFGKDYIVVDTHVHRIFNRLGIVNTKDPKETENELYKIIPKKYWKKINRIFVLFGRHICLPKNPKCSLCPIKEFCKFYKERVKK